MPPFRNLGDLPDRLAMLVLTFVAVGFAVVSFRAAGEPFAWALLAGVLPLLYHNPHRVRGIAAWSVLVLLPVILFAGPGITAGIFAGVIVGCLVRSGVFFSPVLPAAPGQPNPFPVSLGFQLILIGLSMMAWTWIGADAEWIPWLALGLFVGLWAWCGRPAFELPFETALRLLYRVKWVGPGGRYMPPRGPVLVIANHGCWFDPMFMGKLLLRPMKPMMTSRFYNIWYLKPILKYVFRVIVVPDVERRRDAPELKAAAAALNDGECVMLFPEGYLRRTEDKPLRRFGQGAWQILRDCPDVPVIACWIEGAWGTWASYKDGPPTVNKPRDWGRPIRVALAAPVVIPPDILADQMRTRFYLMNLVSGARAYLGLEPLPPFELPTGAGGADDDGK